MKRLTYILLGVLLLSACEMEFDIDRQMSDSMIYLRFAPSDRSDTSFLYIQATTPLKDGKNPVSTDGEQVSVRLNGEMLAMTKSTGRSGTWTSQVYYTTRQFRQGDIIEVEASIPGRETVSSSTTIPAVIPEFRCSPRVEGTGVNRVLCFDIEYDNVPGCSGRYAAGVVMEQYNLYESWYGNNMTGEERWTVEDESCVRSRCFPENVDDNLLSSLGQEPLVICPEALNYSNDPSGYNFPGDSLSTWALAWVDLPGDTPRTGKHQVRVYFNEDRIIEALPHPGWDDSEIPTEAYGSRQTTINRYKLVFYSLDEGAYNYMKALSNSDYSDISMLGIAPVSFTYTNIKGGTGVCGSYTARESEWFHIDQ